jgi:hypothetical protein
VAPANIPHAAQFAIELLMKIVGMPGTEHQQP